MHIRPRLAAAAAAVALLAGGGLAVAAAPAALACSVNCTNATLAVNGTIGTSGFPTSVALQGNAGTTASATASAYSVFSNTTWTLSWMDDASDLVNGNNLPAAWWIAPFSPGSPTLNIVGSTTVTHNGTVYSLPAGTVGSEVTSVQIDSGSATGGGQNFGDVYSVAIPSTQAPGSYQATFAYVLAG